MVVNHNPSVTAIFQYDSLHIHNNLDALAGFSIKGFNISVPDSTTWAQQWTSGNLSNTVNPSVNTLVLQYGITVTNTNNSNGRILFYANTNRAVNTYGLSKAFSAIIAPQSTTYGAGPRGYAFDGNSIELEYQQDGLVVKYHNRCGDCYAGCNYGRRWTFKVFYSNCGVQYLGATNIGTGTNPFDPNTSVFTCTRGPVLPLTFGTFTGYLQSGKPALTWKVLTQVNVKEYIVERSDDGSQFYAVDKLPATAGTSAEYNWKDAQVLSSTAWFRIKAVDVDGKQKYSAIIKLSNSKGGGITIYPNPVQNHQFTVQFATPITGQLQARLYDISGKQVWNTTISVTPQTGSRTFVLPSNLPGGTYSIIMQNEAINYRQTLVIASN